MYAKITDETAKRLLSMLKYTLVPFVTIPSAGKSESFEVAGNDVERDRFSILLYRGKIRSSKFNIGARISLNGLRLLELHINPTNIHFNPDRSRIEGTHWHIFTAEHGMHVAFPAEEITSDNFVENTLLFLKRFHVVEPPVVYYKQDEE